MIDFLICVFLFLMLILMSILEYKQDMERIEFEEKIAKMQYQMKNRDTDNDS